MLWLEKQQVCRVCVRVLGSTFSLCVFSHENIFLKFFEKTREEKKEKKQKKDFSFFIKKR
jgi:hypothetical protein